MGNEEQNYNEEIWKDIPDCPGYQASSLGRIRSRNQVLKVNYTAYASVITNGKRNTIKVHKLVASAFLGECPHNHVICHGPNGSLDNSVSNLSYGTLSKNNGEDRARDGTLPCGENVHCSKLTEEQVREIRLRHAEGETQASLAREFNVRQFSIYKIIHYISWKHVY